MISQSQLPVTVQVTDKQGKVHEVRCLEALRELPQRRLAARGEYGDKPVFIKCFANNKRGIRQWERELKAIQILMARDVPIPVLLLSGSASAEGIRVIVMQWIPNAHTFAEAWQKVDKEAQQQLLQRATGLIALMHENGIVQKDIHLDNLLVGNNGMYCIDPGQVQVEKGRVTEAGAMDNLALFIAQFRPFSEARLQRLLNYYSSLRDEAVEADLAEMVERIETQRSNRIMHLVKKIFRSSTNYFSIREFNRFACIKRSWMTEAAREFMNDPDSFFNTEAKYLKKGGSSTVIRVNWDGRPVVIKRYNLKNPAHALRRALRPTRAQVSWRNAHVLTEYGIDTPEPIAFFERRLGLVHQRAYFVCSYVSGDDAQRWFTQEDETKDEQAVAVAISEMIRKLRRYNIVHGDMKATNIIVHNNSIPVLGDLDAMYICHGKKCEDTLNRDLHRFMRNWDEYPGTQARFKNLLADLL